MSLHKWGQASMRCQQVVEKSVFEDITSDAQCNLLSEALEASHTLVGVEIVLAKEADQSIALSHCAEYVEVLWRYSSENRLETFESF
jgi:hypothetical protein